MQVSAQPKAAPFGWANGPLAMAYRLVDGAFSAADLLMVHVLRRLEGSGLLDEYPNLAAYIARAEARPAFKRALDAQLPVFIAAPNG